MDVIEELLICEHSYSGSEFLREKIRNGFLQYSFSWFFGSEEMVLRQAKSYVSSQYGTEKVIGTGNDH